MYVSFLISGIYVQIIVSGIYVQIIVSEIYVCCSLQGDMLMILWMEALEFNCQDFRKVSVL